jgi:hypothetical protein
MGKAGITSESAAHTLSCVGCAGLVPDVDGPTHPYMQASPGCWQMYGEISASSYAQFNPARVSPVDAYAAQHPGGAENDRRQRRSVAVHLASLCLLLECGISPTDLAAIRGRMSHTVLPRIGGSDWPYLTPPTSPGIVTVVEAQHSIDRGEDAEQVERWADAVWAAWADHHDTVRWWASAALGRLA